MKKVTAICVFYLAFLTIANAQVNSSIAPHSSKLAADPTGKVAEIVLPPFSKAELDKLDYNDAKNGHMPLFGRHIPANINITNTGTWTDLPEGGRIWRVKITAAGAKGLLPLFDRLYLPPGATLHFYMPGKQEILGAYTNDNTPEERSFCPGLIHGETCMVEYYEPKEQKGNGVISINKVCYAYRWVTPLAKSIESGSGPCEVNVVCPEGDNWRNQIRSIAQILVIDNTGAGGCSGALVNNVRQDCTPYILSAEHCSENGVTTSQYAQWIFYFNYQAANCPDVNGPQTNLVNGCKKIADSQDQGTGTGSDFLLLQLLHSPPTAFNVYYSGWDITNTAPASGVGIHHPAGDIKKISTYTSAAHSTQWGNIAQNTHWSVVWAVTANGHGVTEPGSSGSPLFNGSNSLIVGHLTGGGSCCAADGCQNGVSPLAPDLYGKLAYDWTSNGVSTDIQLKPWLDPDNTGTTILQGMNPPCGSTLHNDAGIQAINEPNGTLCSSTISPVVVLRNFGANTLTIVTITYRFDNGTYSIYHWTGNLLAGGTTTVTLPTATLSTGTHTFTAITSAPNGQNDSNNVNDQLTSTLYVTDNAGSLNLSLTIDTAGRKTTWQITDAASNVVASGGPYPDLSGGATYNIPLCLPLGCYTFTIFSAKNNGMEEGLEGGYALTGVDGTPIYASLQNSGFGSQEADSFCIIPLAISQVPAFGFSIVPNPSTGQYNITVDNSDTKTFSIFDITGRLVFTRKTNERNLTVNLGNESKGIYILNIESPAGKAIKKLVLK